MAVQSKILGLRQVQMNLNREILKIKAGSMAGLIEAAVIIRRDMDKTPPVIPVDTGNLRQSWFTTPVKKPNRPGLIIGFSANYAIHVHENLKAKFKRPGAGPRFFQQALDRNHKMILETVRKNARVK